MGKFDARQAQRHEIASIFGVHPSTVSRWKQAGCPVNPDGLTYSAAEVHSWLVERAVNDLELSSNRDCDSPALERYRTARAELVEIELERQRGSVVLRAEIEAAWVERLLYVREALYGLPDRLQTVLAGQPAEIIRQTVRDAVDHIYVVFSRHGRYTPRLLIDWAKLDDWLGKTAEQKRQEIAEVIELADRRIEERKNG